VRTALQQALADAQSPLKETPQAFIKRQDATMHMPLAVGDYTDFYSSEEHATNVGKLFRSKENALLPNWKHLPVGYHGRASSIITSGAEVVRPNGQVFSEKKGQPELTVCRKLDFELEMAFIIGRNSKLGLPVQLNEASSYIAGFVLMNDWSARDIQQWEYRPLGPFLGKSFATAISPWVILPDALEPFRAGGPKQVPGVLPYLKQSGKRNYDIKLEVELKTKEGFIKRITAANSKYLYWSTEQQLVHHTVNGCNIKVGDLMASGTISGKKREEWGSLLEQTFNGKESILIHDKLKRTFLEDGDEISITGWAGEGDYKVGFGTVFNKIVPAPEYIN
jgi:fumarylacetoacetase